MTTAKNRTKEIAKTEARNVAMYGDDLASLIVHFGHDLAMRIYASAIITQDTWEKEDIDMAQAIRITIGMVKRIRRIGYKLLTWAEAVDRLEREQEEGRHYSASSHASTLARECKAIEARNDDTYTKIVDGESVMVGEVKTEKNEKIAKTAKTQKEKEIAIFLELCLKHDDFVNEYADHDKAIMIKDWVKNYWLTMSDKKRKFLKSCVKTVNKGESLSHKQCDNLAKSCPKGVKPLELIEIINRYCA